MLLLHAEPSDYSTKIAILTVFDANQGGQRMTFDASDTKGFEGKDVSRTYLSSELASSTNLKPALAQVEKAALQLDCSTYHVS